MARKSGHTTRPKKTKAPNQARPGPQAVLTEAPPTEGDAPFLAGEPETTIETLAEATPIVEPIASSPRKSRPYQKRKAASTARISTAATITITKEQEYAFIREDLRRLLLTAGALTVVMIGLLFAIDR